MTREPAYLTYSGTFDWLRRRYFYKILDRLEPALPDGAIILDYGCGPGDFMLVARERQIAVEGADISARNVEMARARGLSVSRASAELLQSGKRYDAIICQSVLEHVQDGPQLVCDLAGLLKPGGILVLSTPTPGPFFWDDPTHIRPYTPKSIDVLAELAGLKCDYLSYVFAFLLNWEIRASLIFPILNVIPTSLGSNLVAFLLKSPGLIRCP